MVTEIKVGYGKVYHWLTFVRPTKRQIRREKRAFRNGTHPVFDDYIPPTTRKDMHRMKGAKQAYSRRPNSWADIE